MTIAVVSGSFDPITKGHLYVIDQAKKIASKVIVLIANNPEKKYFFDFFLRELIVRQSIFEQYGPLAIQDGRFDVISMPDKKFTVNVAEELGASIVVRGLRNVVDFEYEHGMQLVNNHISQDVTTLFVMPPPELIAVSSSMIKGMIGIDGWEQVAEKYLPSYALSAMIGKSINVG